MTDVCAVVLAAGEGTRLRPLTLRQPKALCPVGNVPLLDRALGLVARVGLTGPAAVAVNAAWLAEQVVAHVGDRARVSVEPDGPLGTTGGLARLRDWIDGRPVLVGNADAYLTGGSIDPLLAGWDGRTVRLLGVPAAPDEAGTFSGHAFAGFSLLPWRWVRDLPDPASDRNPGRDRGRTSELVHAVWRPAEAAGALEVVEFTGHFRDTGTLGDYLAANLHAAASHHATGGSSSGSGTYPGGNLIAPNAEVTGACQRSVVGAGAVVHGDLTDSVVWPGAVVSPGERLTGAIRIAC